MTKTILITIGVLAFLFVIFFLWCRVRNRKQFLKDLHENQVVRYGEQEQIVRIVSVYMNTAYVCDMKTLEYRQVNIEKIYPL